MKTVKIGQIAKMLVNAAEFYQTIDDSYSRYHHSSKFNNWLITEFDIKTDQANQQLIFRDSQLFDLFVLRFSS